MFDVIHHWVVDLFARTPTVLQGIVLAALLYIIVHVQLRKQKVKFALRQKNLELGEKNLELERTKTQLADAQQRADKLDQESKGLRESVGGLQEKLATMTQQLEETQSQLEYAEKDRAALEDRFDQLQRLDASIWCRGCAADFAPPPFVARRDRKTVFIAVQNLKGGVGKTTLVANLGAAYATCVVDSPLKVLIVDLDFQGTLSNCCVESKDLDYRRINHLTSARLLEAEGLTTRELLLQLMAPISGTEGRASIIVADEQLEQIDFQRQSRFAINSHEARFAHRRWFHDPFVFTEFDLVLFDCPPRLTTSSINALLTSDFIVIPTTLHPFDVQAVPRTLQWISNLSAIGNFPPRLAGIVVNRTYYKEGSIDKLTTDEQRQLEKLRFSVQKYEPTGGAVLNKAIHASPDIARYSAGCLPFGTSPKGREVYRGVAMELYERLKG